MSYYECPKCGAQTEIERSVLTRCPVCGEPIPPEKQKEMRDHINLMKEIGERLSEEDEDTSADFEEDDKNKYIFCPKCLSSRLEVREKGYNVGRATVASLIGAKDAWLWGMWDMKDRICTCKSCGHEFEAKYGCKGTFKGVSHAKQYIDSHLKTKTDAKLITQVASKFGVIGLKETYVRRLRKKRGLPENPGFNIITFIASAIGALIPAFLLILFFDWNFYIAWALCTVFCAIVVAAKN